MKFDPEQFAEFMRKCRARLYAKPDWCFLKVVVFDHADYEFAKKIHKAYPSHPFYVSTGNDAGRTVGNPGRIDPRTTEQIRSDLLQKALWLTNRVMVDPDMRDVKVQTQQHVLLWGNELGR
jgi:7-carboxy-7-deazaguanine synthase